MCELFEVGVEWLNNGVESVTGPSFDEETLFIPYFADIDAAAGEGCEVGFENSDGYFSILKNFVKSSATNLVCINITGDSMEPVLRHRSLAFVDLDNNKCEDGSIYVVRHDSMLRVKCLEKTPYGYLLKSFNSEYKTIEVRTKIDCFHIIGKVVMEISNLE